MNLDEIGLDSQKEKLSRKERKQLRTRRIILDAAEQLFIDGSYDEVTMEEIADQAALSKPTLYNYYNSKEDIFFSIGCRGITETFNKFEKAIDDKDTGYKKVQALTKTLFDDISNRPLQYEIEQRFILFVNRNEGVLAKKLGKIITGDVSMEKEFKQEVLENKYSISTLIKLASSVIKYEQYWASIIKMGQEDGSIRNDFDYDTLVHIILMSIYGFSDQYKKKQYHLQQHNLSRDKIRDLVIELISKYLKPS